MDSTYDDDGQEKQRERFVWECDETDKWGNPLKLFSTYNLSLHPKSYLFRAIVDITGEVPEGECELNGLLGAERGLTIKHDQGSDGRMYANIVAIFRPKTKAESAEERRVASIMEKVKQEARKSHIVAHAPEAQPPDTVESDGGIPF